MRKIKMLAISDLHAEEQVLDRLRMASFKGNYDYVAVLGDITTNGPLSYARDLAEIMPDSFFLFGNNDSSEVAQFLTGCKNYCHGKKIALGDWNVVGWGGSNRTPFNTLFEFEEQEIEKGLEKAGVDEFTILLTHAPPFGFFDTAPGGIHVGSVAVRKVIDRHKPLINVCGHMHEHSGSMLHNETLIVKVPAATKLVGTEITISDSIQAKTIRL
ncbi:MAG TPA: metallophosphoesterase [Candidatus Micrarchaeota archaeon]|nr:metallophosphoesterase [Candidatus Micrarchaeota archaeon]